MTNELEMFRQELAIHQQRLDAGDEKFNHLIKCHNDTCEKLDTLIKNTDPIVKFLNDAKGAASMADRAQSIALWLLKWGTIWAAFITLCVAVRNFFAGN